MITVLLADDEKLFLNDLLSVFDWKEAGFKIIGTAPNGKRALELFRQLSPQVVIADIQMPYMDGLALAEEIRRLDEYTVVVLLTSFQDFEYAHKAIQYNVTDYLLKGEISRELLSEKMSAVRETVEINEKKRRAMKEAAALELFLQNGEHPANAPAHASLFQKPFVYLFVETDYPYTRYGLSAGRQNPSFRLYRWSAEQDESIRFEMCMPLPEATVAVFSVQTHSLHETETALRRKAEEVLREARQRNLRVTAIFHPVPCSLQKMVSEYPEYHRQFQKRFLTGTDRVYSTDSFSTDSAEGGSADDAKEFSPALGPIPEAEALIEQKIEGIIRQNSYTRAVIATQSLSRAIAYLALECRVEIENDSWYDIQEFRVWALEMLRQIKSLPYGSGEKNLSPKIRSVVQFISRHYTDKDLTIETVSEAVQLSAGRLSNKFKSEMGITVNQFITQVRIRHAKALLRQEDSLIYQVATQVGYGSSQYFSQIFQSITGMTPTEYKNNPTVTEATF